MNIARAHRERTLAAQAAEAATGDPLPSVAAEGAVADGMGGIIRPGVAASEAALMLVKLHSDRTRLRQIQSDEGKEAAKREMLPEYQAWLDGLISAADKIPEGTRNDLLSTLTIWSIDAGDYARALELAEVVIARKIPMPAWFDRKAPCAIAEELAKAAFKAISAKADFDPDHIAAVQLLTEAEDMPDEVRAKLFKAAAQLTERRIDALLASNTGDGPAGELQALVASAQADAARALELHDGSRVKALIQKLARVAKKLADERVPAKASAVSS